MASGDMLLEGRRVLLVESHALLALDMSDILQERGASFVQVAARAADAVALLDSMKPDLVILSVTADGQAELNFARSLVVRNIPLIVLSTDAAFLKPHREFSSTPLLTKPVSVVALDDVFRSLLTP